MQNTKNFRAARGLPTSGLFLLLLFRRTIYFLFFRPKGEKIFWDDLGGFFRPKGENFLGDKKNITYSQK